MIQKFSDREPIEFKGFDSDYHKASSGLFSSLSTLSMNIDDLGKNANDAGADIIDDIRKLNDQFKVISDLMLQAVSSNQLQTPIYEDTSEEDIESITMGW